MKSEFLNLWREYRKTNKGSIIDTPDLANLVTTAMRDLRKNSLLYKNKEFKEFLSMYGDSRQNSMRNTIIEPMFKNFEKMVNSLSKGQKIN